MYSDVNMIGTGKNIAYLGKNDQKYKTTKQLG